MTLLTYLGIRFQLLARTKPQMPFKGPVPPIMVSRNSTANITFLRVTRPSTWRQHPGQRSSRPQPPFWRHQQLRQNWYKS